MSKIGRLPVLRWLVPVLAAVLLLGGGWTATHLTATAQPGLAPRTPAQLLVDMQHAHLDGFSGTVTERAALGLPDLPGGSSSTDLKSLVSGSHTMKVWASAPRQARLALLGDFGESDIVRNGNSLWVWSSHDKTAQHWVLPPHSGQLPRGGHGMGPQGLGPRSLTPQQAARRALDALDPTTKVSTDGTAVVAGRRAYELVLEPRDTASLVGQVRIAVDGRTHVPLRVQVLPRGSTTPAFETAFTSFDPTRPDPSVFDFRPPPGTKVTQERSPGMMMPGQHGMPPKSQGHGMFGHGPQGHGMLGHGPQGHGRLGQHPTVVGHGWSTVVVTKLPAGSSSGVGLPGPLSQMVQALPRVSGSWGAGRLLRGTLFSVVLTDDGRMAVGAVAPESLYAALNRS